MVTSNSEPLSTLLYKVSNQKKKNKTPVIHRKIKLFLTVFLFSVLVLLALFLQASHAQKSKPLASLLKPIKWVYDDLQSGSPLEIISGLVNSTVLEVSDAVTICYEIRKQFHPTLDPRAMQALDDCLELFDDTVLQLRAAVAEIAGGDFSFRQHYMDVQTLLSAAITNQYTCLDGFAFSKKKHIRKIFAGRLRQIIGHVNSALEMVNKIKNPVTPEKIDKALPKEFGWMDDGYPTWMSEEDKELLEAAAEEIKVNVTVAKDGSGNFTTINEALEVAPKSSNSTRFVIYIKAGVYYEYVNIERKQSMIMFVGDGIGMTLIKGNKSVGGGPNGTTTFRSATVAVVGEKFIGRGITFVNYAGPSNAQAVALRVNSNDTVFYKCSFVGYQDTLYVHSLRQFFRECHIYGTVDFIFGNSLVVFQKCNIYVRRPNPGQRNMVTAQGRAKRSQVTGISILNCRIDAAPDLKPVESSFKSYLGRPWRRYSRTVILRSYIGSLIDPAGWDRWSGDFALDTLYYGEYENRGPGSNTSERVDWPGYRVITNETEAEEFSVRNFIRGKEWLPETGIPFYLDLKP